MITVRLKQYVVERIENEVRKQVPYLKGRERLWVKFLVENGHKKGVLPGTRVHKSVAPMFPYPRGGNLMERNIYNAAVKLIRAEMATLGFEAKALKPVRHYTWVCGGRHVQIKIEGAHNEIPKDVR